MSNLNPANGTLFGVGVGPGDPELMTLKAARVLGQAEVVAYFAKAGNQSHSLRIASEFIPSNAELLALEYPVTTEIDRHHQDYREALASFYTHSVERIRHHLLAGRQVAVIAEGDPLFFGSYMHLHTRLAGDFMTQVIPGISAMSASWSAVQVPICQGDDIFTVVPGTLDKAQLMAQMSNSRALVIMKIGSHLGKVREALKESGLLDRAVYVERVAQQECRMLPLAEKQDDTAPYFSLVLVPGWEDAGFASPLFTHAGQAKGELS